MDLGGDHLLPGLVELHTDHLERHFTPRPGVQWDPLPAALASDAQLAAAGVTTVLDAVRIGSALNQNDAAAAAARVLADSIEQAADAGLLRADHAIHVRCEVAAEDCLDAFSEFGDDPHVRLVSLMDHTPGQRQYADMELFKRYQIAKGNVTESGFAAYVAPLIERSARYADVHRRAIAGLAAQRGITLATHDDATPEHVAESVELGVRISEFPTTVPAATAADKHGQLIVMGAPNIVRGGSQSGNVAAAELLGLGLLHILSSDYVPSSPLQAVFQLCGRRRDRPRRRREAGQRKPGPSGRPRPTAARSRSASAPTWCRCGRTTCRPPNGIRADGACRSSAACTGRARGSRDRADRRRGGRLRLEAPPAARPVVGDDGPEHLQQGGPVEASPR